MQAMARMRMSDSMRSKSKEIGIEATVPKSSVIKYLAKNDIMTGFWKTKTWTEEMFNSNLTHSSVIVSYKSHRVGGGWCFWCWYGYSILMRIYIFAWLKNRSRPVDYVYQLLIETLFHKHWTLNRFSDCISMPMLYFNVKSFLMSTKLHTNWIFIIGLLRGMKLQFK